MSDRSTASGVIFLLWLAGLGAAATDADVSAPDHVSQAGYGDAGAELGFAVSLVGIVAVLLGVSSALLVARICCRTALLWALWIGAAIALVQALLPSFWLFQLARTVEGVSHLAIGVAALTLVAMLCATRHTGPVRTLWATFFGAAFVLVVFAGRPLAETYSAQAMLLARGCCLAVIAILVAVTFRRARDGGLIVWVSLAFRLGAYFHGAVHRRRSGVSLGHNEVQEQ